MRIAIVDDIAEERSLLTMWLKDQLGSRNVHADFFEYERGEDFLKAAGKSPFTILFLDIYMNGINGIETAKKLRSFDKDCLLIFTTTSTDHALEGFQVRATHYLVKPYTDKDLSALTEELLSRIPEPDRYIEIKVNGSDVQLPFKDIIYAEHFSHIIHIHTTGGQTLITRQSFENFTAPLKEDPRFFPSSRGTIVNLEHAIGFDDSAFVMKDGSTVLISRKLLKTARQALMDFLFQGGGMS